MSAPSARRSVVAAPRTLVTPVVRRRGLARAKSTATTGACSTPTTTAKQSGGVPTRGVHDRDHGHRRGPPEAAYLQGKMLGVRDSRPLGAGMDSSAFRRRKKYCHNGACTRPTTTAELSGRVPTRGVRDRHHGPLSRSAGSCLLAGEKAWVSMIHVLGVRDELVCRAGPLSLSIRRLPYLRRQTSSSAMSSTTYPGDCVQELSPSGGSRRHGARLDPSTAKQEAFAEAGCL